jgi:alkaline phosphatase
MVFKSKYFKLILFTMLWVNFIKAQKPIGLSFAHAHNDYEKLFRKDFKKAIRFGCTSIEIDVFPYRGQLKVAHVPILLIFRTNLEKRYLKPLQKFIKDNGNIFQNPTDKLILMVDIKRNTQKAYGLLKALCAKYEDVLTIRHRNGSTIKDGSLQVLLSGSKPYEALYADSIRYMQLDGGLGDIGNQKFGPEIIPRVSTSYRGNFKWRGYGKIPYQELQFLKETVKRAKEDGRELRFWGMPNNLNVLNLMLREGVHWLNIDRLKMLKKLDAEALRARGE